jgi:hypothetical protein
MDRAKPWSNRCRGERNVSMRQMAMMGSGTLSKGLAFVLGGSLVAGGIVPAEAQQVVWIWAQVLEASDPEGASAISPAPPRPALPHPRDGSSPGPASPPGEAASPRELPADGPSREGRLRRESSRPREAARHGPRPPETATDDYPAPILNRIRKLFRYRDYQTLARLRAQSPLGVTQTFAIPGNSTIEVTPEKLRDRWVQLRVVLREGGRIGLSAGVVAPPGAPAIFGGPTRGDRALIVILWASPGAAEPPPPR